MVNTIDSFLFDGLPSADLIRDGDLIANTTTLEKTCTLQEAEIDGNGHGEFIGACGHIIRQCRCKYSLNNPHKIYCITDKVCTSCENGEKSLSQHKYGCVLAVLPEDIRKEISDWCIENLQEEHLFTDQSRELRSHVTVLYGFKGDDTEEIVQTLRAMLIRYGPIKIKLGDCLSTFPVGKDGVPLKIDVESPQLHELNSLFRKMFDVYVKFPIYHPHMTLGYLREECVHLYSEEQPSFLNREIILDEVEYASPQGARETIPLIFRLNNISNSCLTVPTENNYAGRIETPIINRSVLGIKSAFYNQKDMSWLANGSGGALVKPVQLGNKAFYRCETCGKQFAKRPSVDKCPDCSGDIVSESVYANKYNKSLRLKYKVKSQGQPCKPGETAESTGCIPSKEEDSVIPYARPKHPDRGNVITGIGAILESRERLRREAAQKESQYTEEDARKLEESNLQIIEEQRQLREKTDAMREKTKEAFLEKVRSRGGKITGLRAMDKPIARELERDGKLVRKGSFYFLKELLSTKNLISSKKEELGGENLEPFIQPAPFQHIKSLNYLTKARGQPCLRGETAKQSGCIPKSKLPRRDRKPPGAVERFNPKPELEEENPDSLYLVDIDPSWSPTWQKKIKDSQAFAQMLYNKSSKGEVLSKEEIAQMPKMLKGLHSKSISQLFKKVMGMKGMGYKRNQISDLIEYAKKKSTEKDKPSEEKTEKEDSPFDKIELAPEKDKPSEETKEKPVPKVDSVSEKKPDKEKITKKDPPLSQAGEKLLEGIAKNTTEAVKKDKARFETLAHALGKILDKKITVEEMRQTLQEAYAKAEWTINFDPDDPAAGSSFVKGRTLADALTEESRLKNLYEVNRSGGTSDKRIRLGWEKSNFGDAVQDLDIVDRPKYGSVNWGDKKSGGASSYGDAVFVMNKDALKNRVTLAPSNTSNSTADNIATATDPFNAIARNGQALKRAFNLNDGQIIELKYTMAGSGGRPLTINYDYTEIQMWGNLPFDSSTVSTLRLPNYSKDKPDYIKMAKLAERLGVPVEYYDYK